MYLLNSDQLNTLLHQMKTKLIQNFLSINVKNWKASSSYDVNYFQQEELTMHFVLFGCRQKIQLLLLRLEIYETISMQYRLYLYWRVG